MFFRPQKANKLYERTEFLGGTNPKIQNQEIILFGIIMLKEL